MQAQDQSENGQPTDTDVVQTKNLTYSYITLMPKDKREAKIYYFSKLHEVGDNYKYYMVMVGGLVITDAIEFN